MSGASEIVLWLEEEKLSALRERDISVEAELQTALEELYCRSVPQVVREEIQKRLEAAVRAGQSPECGEGKEICDLHRRWLTITGNQYDPAKHRGIAELYVMDERFTAYYDKRLPGCARFLRDAVVHWVK